MNRPFNNSPPGPREEKTTANKMAYDFSTAVQISSGNEETELELFNEVDLEVPTTSPPNEEAESGASIEDDDSLSDVWSARSNGASGGLFQWNNGKLYATGAALLALTMAVAGASSKAAKNSIAMSKQAEPPRAKSAKAPSSSKSAKGSCVSGDTGVFKVDDDESVSIMTVKDAKPGDKVKGLDDDLNEAVCEVTALGYWGVGTLFGNYTPSHYIYDESSGNIVEHGEVGDESDGDLFILLSTCPLVIDESETAFTPLDSDVNFSSVQEKGIMSWTDYLSEFKSFSTLVGAVGPCIMDQDGYDDVEGFKAFSVVFNEAVKKCVENGGDDCIATVDLWEGSMVYYNEPCKSQYLTAIGPLLALRDANDAASIQALFSSQTSAAAAALI